MPSFVEQQQNAGGHQPQPQPQMSQQQQAQEPDQAAPGPDKLQQDSLVTGMMGLDCWREYSYPPPSLSKVAGGMAVAPRMASFQMPLEMGAPGYPPLMHQHHHHHHQLAAMAAAAAAAGCGMPIGMGLGPHSVSGLSRESSRDDLTSMGDGHFFEYEDCFKVDRRKLEMLILGSYEPLAETAVQFFGRIGEDTNTTVIWPSRLKIGAKSRKDPHIRVGGSEEGVRRAKGRIMEYLSAKSNRVTLKMDVSYTDHSHVIGKCGNTIRRVMAETNCHIHFPDSNRTNPNEKSNQVSIAGEIEGVERARARVREQTPLVFNFDLPIIPNLHSSPDNNDPYLKAIQDQYNIQVKFRQKQKNFTTMVVVRGCEWEASRVKEATLLLMEHLSQNAQAELGTTPVNALCVDANLERHAVNQFPMNPGEASVIMNMEISPQHHAMVLGKGNMMLKLIMQRTNTTILFPDASDPNIPSIRKGSVSIIGTIHNVHLARQQLIGSLPLVMMFDLHYDTPFEESLASRLQETLDVLITIKPKAKQGNKSVIIKAAERNASAIYEARAVLLGLEDSPVKAVIPESYNILAISPATGMTLPMNQRTFSSAAAANTNNATRASQRDAMESLGNAFRDIDISGNDAKLAMPRMPGASWKDGDVNNTHLSDYEQKTLSATNAILNCKPQGEVQTPNRYWAGFGFSSSMPKSVIKDNIQSEDAKRGALMSLSGDDLAILEEEEINSLRSSANQQQHDEGGSEGRAMLHSCGSHLSSSSSSSSIKLFNTRVISPPRYISDGSRIQASSPSRWFGNSSTFDFHPEEAPRLISASSGTSGGSTLGGPEVVTQDDLPKVLAMQGLSRYTSLFLRHEIDLATFSTLSDQDLKEIGITIFGARKKLLILANKVQQKMTQSSSVW